MPTAAETVIRRATDDDVATIARMGLRFVRFSPYRAVDPKVDDVAAGVANVIETGVGFVAEREGRIVGFILGALAPLWFAPRVTVAAELAWWVQPEHRNTRAGIKLLNAFEAWAEDHGARVVLMMDLIVDGKATTGETLRRLNYHVVERVHAKET